MFRRDPRADNIILQRQQQKEAENRRKQVEQDNQRGNKLQQYIDGIKEDISVIVRLLKELDYPHVEEEYLITVVEKAFFLHRRIRQAGWKIAQRDVEGYGIAAYTSFLCILTDGRLCWDNSSPFSFEKEADLYISYNVSYDRVNDYTFTKVPELRQKLERMKRHR